MKIARQTVAALDGSHGTLHQKIFQKELALSAVQRSAVLAPAINSGIKTIMALDAVASFVRRWPYAATSAKGPLISCLTR